MKLKLKRHYPLLILLSILSTILTLGIGDQRIIAYAESGSSQIAAAGSDIQNEVALFDENVVHSIQILISDEDYQEMIKTYQETGEKDYYQADVIIDGVRVSNAGIRLKGNASLRSVLGGKGSEGDGAAAGGRPGGSGNRADGAQGGFPGGAPNARTAPPDMAEGEKMPRFDAENMPDGMAMAGAPQGGGRSGNIDEEDSLTPLLVKFDEYIEGQTYQGYSALALRTYGTSYDASLLQEPVTNAIFRLVGLPATQTAYSGVQLNDEAERLYVISEIIDEKYLAHYFTYADGVLYKAEVGANLSYEGEDPTSYAGSFSQETRLNDADMAPLIDFIRFLNESDDAAFESHLPDYLDVEAFAAYLAANNLLVNTDTIAGMNNNYYLYYDYSVKRFTLLMWDSNESLGKLAHGEQSASYDLYYAGQNGGGMHMGGKNVLVSRFLENETFNTLYEQKLQEIYHQVFDGNLLVDTVEAFSHLITQTNDRRELVDADDYRQAVSQVLEFISQRRSYLASTALLGAQAGITE